MTRALVISVAESMGIFRPIFRGMRRASESGVTLSIETRFARENGPPAPSARFASPRAARPSETMNGVVLASTGRRASPYARASITIPPAMTSTSCWRARSSCGSIAASTASSPCADTRRDDVNVGMRSDATSPRDRATKSTLAERSSPAGDPSRPPDAIATTRGR